MNLTIGDDCVVYQIYFESPICNTIFLFKITVHFIYLFSIGILFYGGIAHLIMNILMVTKRIFKLFDKEIDLLTNPEEDYEVSKKKESDSSKEGKEDNDEVKDTL